MLSDINVFLGGAILALFLTLITSALQIAGVISVNIARLLLFTAWLVAVIGVCGSMENAPARHLALAATVTGIPLGLSLIVLERWISSTGKPRLNGNIICLEVDPRLHTKDNDYDCFITLCVKVRNKGTPTAVDTFSLDLWWEGVDHPGLDEPLDGYVVETVGREPGDWGEPKRKTRTTPLYGFPMSQEITTTSETGWLRFSFGSLPPEMVDRGMLARAVILELTVKDSQETSHTIYKGTLYDGVVSRLAGCGKIVKYPF